ncbi:MAG: FG-GAP repeat domain-containing protein, partial [Rhodothermales bacterium]
MRYAKETRQHNLYHSFRLSNVIPHLIYSSRLPRYITLCSLLFILSNCTTSDPVPAPQTPPWFQEISKQAGIDFKHVRASASNFYFPEIMSGGVAWIDYDNDGLLDLYLVQGGDIDTKDAQFTNVLYRNIDGKHFEDVTIAAGVGDTGYGMGVAVGDVDNDGDPDLYVTNVGPNVLYRNEGDGTFTDISVSSGTNHAGWGASAAFADYDGDGLQDLYITNYINWAPHQEIECFSGGSGRDYCHPDNYRSPAADALFKNEGDGRFVDVTAGAGIDAVSANGLGVVPGYFNDDYLIDFYVANDGNPNQLWQNNGDGTFTDRALITGVSANRQGTAEAGMGVIAFDLENDGDTDLLLTHLRDETNTLYRNDNGNFQDVTIAAGLSSPSLPYTGFGLGVADFNHDGLLDIYVANGKVGRGKIGQDNTPDTSGPFAEPNQLFKGTEAGKFVEVEPAGGVITSSISTSRGTALADIDNDGDLDIAVINNHGS